MRGVLRRKLTDLVCGEEGVALVVTLALFMFMYVSCAGVFAVGRAVKERIILQNAADAAAYSAAVVQADMLSRIAAINRAMAWTYKDMVCRQMDYVTWKWLTETDRRYTVNQAEADFIGASRGGKHGTVDLNSETPEMATVRSRLSSFDPEAAVKAIGDARRRLEEMNLAIEDLVDGFVKCVEANVQKAIAANLPGRIGDLCLWKIRLADPSVWTEILSDESRFLALADLSPDGFREWFPRDGEAIMRSYTREREGLLSKWHWRERVTSAPHDEENDALDHRDEWYEGRQSARPVVLSRNCFDDGDGLAGGAISVAVAKYNENPWKGPVEDRNLISGIYAAFTYSDATKWTWAVSSAQAGYRDVNPDAGDLSKPGFDYSVRWNEEETGRAWNLRTEDWDAVFVPVRKAFDAEGFAGFITDAGGWEPVEGADGSDRPAYNVLGDPSAPLPRMHNDGGAENRLDWAAESFLDLMFH